VGDPAGEETVDADAGPVPGDGGAHDPVPARRRVRTVVGWVTTGLACLLVWFTLVAPNEASRFTPGAFVSVPLEGLLIVALVLVVPARARGMVAALVGLVLGVLTIVKLLDMVLFVALNRPFNPVIDRGYLKSAEGLLTAAIGHRHAVMLLIAAAALGAALLVLVPLSVVRLTRLVTRHRTRSLRTIAALGVVWILCAVFGAQITLGAPVASTSTAGVAYEQVSQVRAGLDDQQRFAQAAAVDPFRNTPGDNLLTALHGKDVIVAVVESYGRVAVQDASFAPPVNALLDDGTNRLRGAGFSARSAFLTSPTFGGISWLAHSTLQSGLWIDNQQRYDDLVTTDRLTLSSAFKRAGWRTVGDVPSNGENWAQGTSFYHYDTVYDARNVGYAGPAFAYASMPDQYIMSAFQRLELAKAGHAPVMAEIDLVSSHTPWAPLPKMVDWSKVGDGSIFRGMPAQGQKATVVWRDPNQVRAAYGRSIQYSMNTLISFVQTYGNDNLVLVLYGDHQPATMVSGQGASHDVPISIIAHDPKVMDRISGWGWQDGMRPGPQTPVWPMDSFRDRFLTAFGPQQTPPPQASQAHH
jgi:hypothetical protein